MDPLSILSMASGGASILGNLFGGITSFIGGQEKSAEEKAAASQAEAEAAVNVDETLQSGDALVAKAATQAAANGGGLVGSSIGVIGQASRNAYFNARAQAYRGNTTAAADLYDAKVSEDNGINGLIGGFLGAGASGASAAEDFGFRKSILNSQASRSGEADPTELQGIW